MASIVKLSLSILAVLATTFVRADCDTLPQNKMNVFTPVLHPGVDTHSLSQLIPQTNVSLIYGSNTTVGSSIQINQTMRYPTVLLEQIASIISVDCSADSVAITFNDLAVFGTTQSAWTADGSLVIVTNHLGDCDVELERGYFLANSVGFDNATLVATANAQKANVSTTAGKLTIVR